MALNGNRVINEDTRKRVELCARKMQYTPNYLAKGLVTSRTYTIGVVCTDPENSCIGNVVKHIAILSKNYGYSVVFSVSQFDLKQEAQCIRNLMERKCDGLIIIPTDFDARNSESISLIRNCGIPYVFCISYYSGFKNDAVMTDYALGSYDLTKYLLQNGHREIWYLVTNSLEVPVSKFRIEGYKKAYDELGIRFDPDWIIRCRDINYKNAYKKILHELGTRKTPDGILSINDYSAYGVIRAVNEMGLKIPQDISIAGYDDVFYAEFASMTLTTVNQDIELIAQNTLKLLLTRMDKNFVPSDPIQQRIKPRLVIRDTTMKRTAHDAS